MRDIKQQSGFTQHLAARLSAVGRYVSPKEKDSLLGAGFTIIELLVATTIFSIVLVVIVASFLQVGRMFYKGVSVNNTNNTARALVDDISNDIRLSKTTSYADPKADTADANKLYFCVGQHRYTYVLHTKVQDTDITTTTLKAKTMRSGVVQDNTGGNCQQPSSLDGTGATQLLGPDMQLNALTVAKNTTGSAVRIHSHLIFYGADTKVFNSPTHPKDNNADHDAALNDTNNYCSGNSLSTQFCAVSDIDTNITLGF